MDGAAPGDYNVAMRSARPNFRLPAVRAHGVFLVVVAVVAGAALASRYWPVGFDRAVDEVLDGDAERAELARCLRTIRAIGIETAAERGDAVPALQAAASALVLGDQERFLEIIAEALRRDLQSPFLAGGSGSGTADSARVAALGYPAVRSLWLAEAAYNGGDRAAARQRCEQAFRSARLAGLELVEKTAREAYERFR